MNYPQARRKARTLFGKEGDAMLVRGTTSLFKPLYTVGITRGGQFVPLGAGTSWEAAFTNVKEVPHGEGKSEEVSSGSAAKEGAGGDGGSGNGDLSPTTSVQRVKLT